METQPSPAISAPLPPITPYEQKQLLPFGILVKTSFRVWREHASAFVQIGLVPLIASVLFSMPQLVGVRSPAFFGLFQLVVVVVSIFYSICLFTAVSEGMALPQGIWGVYKRAGKLFFPFVWLFILVIAMTFGGGLLLAVPGILVGVRTSLSLFAFVVEGRRGLSAHAYSWHLVRGHTWSVLWRFLVLALVVYVPLVLFFVLVGFVGSTFTDHTLAPAGDPAGLRIVLQNPALGGGSSLPAPLSITSSILISTPTYFIVIPILYIFSFLLYQSLKEMKGSPTPEEERKIRKTLKIFAWLGVVAILFVAVIATLGILLITLLTPSGRTGPY